MSGKLIGKLIVLDGSDGVGKRTQTALLVERLKKDGHIVRTLDFPQYEKNFFGGFIKECLSGDHGNFVNTDPYLASLPYAADRFESKGILEKWLAEGAIIVLDRYVSANQMHQGGKIFDDEKRDKFLKWLDTMEHTVFGIPRPDLILYLHVPVDVSLTLIAGREGKKDQHESDPLHLANAQDSALRLIEAQGNWHMIDCTEDGALLSREEIHKKIYENVKKAVT